MKILQAWSSGFDSTCLLYKNLREGNEVYPIYIDSKRIDKVKRECELRAIKEITETLGKQFNNYYTKLYYHENVEVFVGSEGVGNGYSYQPFLWIMGLFNHVISNPHIDFDEVHIGYIMNDDALSFIEDLKILWNHLFKFNRTTILGNKKIPRLEFPLKYFCKQDVLTSLKEANLLNSCWTCENPEFINGQFYHCATCTPCTHLKPFIYLLDKSHKNNVRFAKFERDIPKDKNSKSYGECALDIKIMTAPERKIDSYETVDKDIVRELYAYDSQLNLGFLPEELYSVFPSDSKKCCDDEGPLFNKQP